MTKIAISALIAAFVLGASTAQAAWAPTSVKNTNEALVENVVAVSATTGSNTADAGSASNKVSGADVSTSESGPITTGNGGNTATGGQGGIITSGNALASAHVENNVNYNETEVSSSAEGDVRVRNRNGASVGNLAAVSADTGLNVADGGRAKNKVRGADVSSSSSWGAISAGNGGNDSTGGMGGDILTGTVEAHARVVNNINTNITRR